jgi:hypothetical protein
VFTLVKRYRDGFVHQRRTPVQLHGEHATATFPSASQTTTKGISAELHLAMALGFYDLILRPSCELVGTLIHVTTVTVTESSRSDKASNPQIDS